MRERTALLAVFFVLVLAVAPTTVAAESRSGSTVIVAADETINEDLTATGGTVIVHGTVNGDLDAFAGDVFVDGQVNGDMNAFAGNVRVNGTVSGEAGVFGGNFHLQRGGVVGGELEAAGGNVVLDGTVRRDATVGAGSITLGPTAVIQGGLEYSGDLTRSPDARVAGAVVQNEQMAPGPVPAVPNWLGAVYGFFVNLLLGVLLLALFPTFSDGVADRARTEPLLSGGVGVLVLVVVPLVLFLFAITLVGIPITLLGALLFAVLLWAAAVYGAFAVGAWLLSLADSESRWLALVVGLVVVAVLTAIPIVGGFVQFFVLLLGLGALSLAMWARYRGRRVAPDRRAPTPSDPTTDDESPAAD